MYQYDEVAVAFFYCEYNESQSQTSLSFTSSLLRQFVTHLVSVPSCVEDFYQKTRDHIKDQAWSNELQTILLRVATTFGHCFVIIDAFDELTTEHRLGLLGVLKALQGAAAARLFITMRPHLTSTEGMFEDAIKIEAFADEQDLRRYLSVMIASHEDSDYIMDDGLKVEILDRLCSNARGM